MALSTRHLAHIEVVRRSSPLQLSQVAVARKALMEAVRLEVRSGALWTPFGSHVCHFVVVGKMTFVRDLRTPPALIQYHYLLVIANWD